MRADVKDLVKKFEGNTFIYGSEIRKTECFLRPDEQLFIFINSNGGNITGTSFVGSFSQMAVWFLTDKRLFINVMPGLPNGFNVDYPLHDIHSVTMLGDSLNFVGSNNQAVRLKLSTHAAAALAETTFKQVLDEYGDYNVTQSANAVNQPLRNICTCDGCGARMAVPVGVVVECKYCCSPVG